MPCPCGDELRTLSATYQHPPNGVARADYGGKHRNTIALESKQRILHVGFFQD